MSGKHRRAMCDASATPAEACAPDADRAEADASALLPAWLAYLVAVIILFVLQRALAFQRRRDRRLCREQGEQTLLARRSEQSAAASVGDGSAHVIRAGRAQRAAPERADRRQLYRALDAIFARLDWQEPTASSQPQPAASGNIPGGISVLAEAREQPASRHAPSAVATAPDPASKPKCTAGPPILSLALWRQVFDRAATGPPVISGCRSCCA